MPKLFQINVCSNLFSTGKIAEDIAKVAQSKGWETFMAYGRSYKEGVSTPIRIGSRLSVYEHYLESLFFDNEGFASRKATTELVEEIKKIDPDVIQLHNLHDHYLNFKILFEYLIDSDKPVVWTQHDCWSFTGGCMYMDFSNCYKWKNTCYKCDEKSFCQIDRSKNKFETKRRLLSSLKKLTLVPVSYWLESLIRESYLKTHVIKTIHNGIDINKFSPQYYQGKHSDDFVVLGVAAVWDKRKGLEDIVKLRGLLPERYKIVLVGLTDRQISELPNGIEGIARTHNVEELVSLYANSDVFINPTYSDNFPTTNIEALACGTPVITYNTGGSPEAIDDKTGIVVKQGNVSEMADAIIGLEKNPLDGNACRKRAVDMFDKDKCFESYIELYNNLLGC